MIMSIKNTKARGFTVVELLIVMSISALLMSLLIFYSRAGERQIILLNEQAKLVNAILRSKALSIQTYNQPVRVCGYGVHFSQAGYLIFKDLADNCSSSDKRYSGDNEMVQLFVLDQAVKFRDVPLTDVLFVPPDPVVVFNPTNLTEATVILADKNDQLSLGVKINSAGQVTTTR